MNSELERLSEIAKQLKEGQVVDRVSVRTLLAWFGAQRRGYYIVQHIRRVLATIGLRTDPDFEGAYIDEDLVFSLAGQDAPGTTVNVAATGIPTTTTVGAQTIAATATEVLLAGGGVADPTYRIGKLPAANRTPLSVKPDSPLQEAVTLMLSHDYSQLPVMQTEYNVKGMISWTSIGARLALHERGEVVRDYMEPYYEISADVSLFNAIDAIVENQYVLIRDSKRALAA
jgi:CBS domain-containing protein